MMRLKRHSQLHWWARYALPTLQLKSRCRVGKGAIATCPPIKFSVTSLNALLFLALSLLVNTALAESRAMTQTKSQLRQLENKMSQLQLNINHTHDKQDVLTKELSHTEKQIKEGNVALKKIQGLMKANQHQITTLHLQVNTLSEQLRTQQHLLAEHIRARYKMGEYQPFKWLLNQESPDAISRLLTFHQYLVNSRQRIMKTVSETKQTLILSQNKLNQELVDQEHLQQQLNKRQQAFDYDKHRHTTLLSSLKRDIKAQEKTLQTCQQNKANLARLLSSLVQQSVLQTRHPFSQMRQKLHQPVATNSGGVQKINQGVVFYADAGTPVVSVASGKIVFSDWLNGYGLLLIVDHGWGFMTLYANNQTLLKHKGDIVKQDEKIAIVGHSGTFKQNGLYFEIRQRGKAVNPLEWMSSRRI